MFRQVSFQDIVGYWYCRFVLYDRVLCCFGVLWLVFNHVAAMEVVVLPVFLHSEDLSGLGLFLFSDLLALLGKDWLSRMVRVLGSSILFLLPSFVFWVSEASHYFLEIGRRFPVQASVLYVF